jgi:branched-chain amino acid transport system permease protein
MQAVVVGLAMGAVYGLMALGLALLFGVMRTINFAHGAMFTLGGYAFVAVTDATPIPSSVAVLAAPVAAFVVGWLLHAALLRPPPGSSTPYADYVLIVTFGVTIVLVNLAIITFGPQFRRPPSISSGTVNVLDLVLGADRFVAAAVAVIATAGLWFVLRYTFTGRSWRAMAQNPTGAAVVGIDARQAHRSAFATSCGLAGLAGGLLAPLTSVFPTSGVTPLLISFVVLVIGGLGSMGGALLGGLLVGVATTLGVVYVSSAYSEVYAYILMLAVLLLRPTGLFTRAARTY